MSEKHQLDPEQVKAVAKERGYDTICYATLGKLERNVEKGTFTPELPEYLRTGRMQQETVLREMPTQQLCANLPPPKRRQRQPILSAAFQSLERLMHQLSRALAPKTRTQDVHCEIKKARDYE